MSNKKLVVVGGGAAGFFCAVNAAAMNPGLQVTIIEKWGKLLSKVKVSGGGRCNVTHACFSIAEMVKKYPRGSSFLKKSFQHFFTTDTIRWFREKGIELKTEPDGRMFPVTDSSQTIINCLELEAARLGVKIIVQQEVIAVTPDGTGFSIKYKDEREMYADYVCIASGGYPKSDQFKWLQQLGHTIEVPLPSLFTFNMPGNAITSLMGIVVDPVQVKIVGSKLTEQGPLLITHWGMSGPAILKLSAWGARELAGKNWHFSIVVNWLPAFNEQALKEKFQQVRFELAAQKMANRNPFAFPQRLWDYFLQISGVGEHCRWADLPGKEQNKLIKNICAGEFVVQGKTTFKEEFVTSGGIALPEVSPDTMQSRIIPNLYFAGEVLNIDGLTGGFNFQNAWTTGWIAARSIAQNDLPQ